MTLHIFNPEHDIALASGLANFTAPHAGRQLRHDLGFLPALWAQDGDAVLVENPERASFDYLRMKLLIGRISLRSGLKLQRRNESASLPKREEPLTFPVYSM